MPRRAAMTARIFISYRTSDGVDKATALARDLNAAFGADQVFLDKEDLGAGQLWREAVGAAMDGKPVLLMLVTPQTFGARIADDKDPVRREIESALAVGAHVIPVLADGVDQLPDAQALPPSLQSLADRTWRRLRAYDWRDDVERLVADLQALGIAPAMREPAASLTPRRRVLELAAALGFGAVGGAALSWWTGAGRRSASDDVVAAAVGASAASSATASAATSSIDAAHPFTGTWVLIAAPPPDSKGMLLNSVVLHITQVAETVKFYSRPIEVAADPAWAEYAAHWKRRTGFALDRLVMRGDGQARLEHGSSPALGAAVRFDMPGVGGDPIESGRLTVEADASRITLTGLLWLNGEQARRNVQLMRSS
jgi:hypothetical protein